MLKEAGEIAPGDMLFIIIGMKNPMYVVVLDVGIQISTNYRQDPAVALMVLDEDGDKSRMVTGFSKIFDVICPGSLQCTAYYGDIEYKENASEKDLRSAYYQVIENSIGIYRGPSKKPISE